MRISARDSKLRAAQSAAQIAFETHEQERRICYFEFLYQQSHFIRKRIWLFQSALLFVLWFVLQYADTSLYIIPTLIVPLMLILCFLMSGIFPCERNWKADAVFFSSQYGRTYATRAKVKAGLMMTAVGYLCMVLTFSAVMLGIFGTNGAQCQIQTIAFGWKCLFNLKVWQVYLIVFFGGLIGCLFLSGVRIECLN